MKGCFSFLCFALIVFFLAGCNQHGTEDAEVHAVSPTDPGNGNTRLVDSAVSLLHTGDLVLRMGSGAQSMLLSRLNKTDKRFSHCGLVILENGYPFVYHCIGGEDNPDARMRRDSAFLFFSPLHNTALAIARYDLDSAEVKSTILNYYCRKPRFDLNFDMATNDALYCTEFAWKVITGAAGDSTYLPLSELNGRQYVGTDNLYLNNHAHVVWQVQFM